MIWVIWGLFAFGLVYFGVAASIAERPRDFLYSTLGRFGELGRFARGVLACGPCFAFWVGALLGLPDDSIVRQLTPWAWSGWIVEHAIAAFVVMGLVALVQYFAGMAIAHIARDEAYRSSVDAAAERADAERKAELERWAKISEVFTDKLFETAADIYEGISSIESRDSEDTPLPHVCCGNCKPEKN